MFSKYIKPISFKLSHFLSITVSGEIGIMKKSIKETIFNDDKIHNEIHQLIVEFGKSYPYIKIETVRSIHETNIKIFAMNKKTYALDYIENLNDKICQLVDTIYSIDDFKIRVNVDGVLTNWYEKSKFIIMNNGKEMHFKITETNPPPVFNKYIGVIIKKLFKYSNYVCTLLRQI